MMKGGIGEAFLEFELRENGERSRDDFAVDFVGNLAHPHARQLNESEIGNIQKVVWYGPRNVYAAKDRLDDATNAFSSELDCQLDEMGIATQDKPLLGFICIIRSEAPRAILKLRHFLGEFTTHRIDKSRLPVRERHDFRENRILKGLSRGSRMLTV